MEAVGVGVGRCERFEAWGGEGPLLAPLFSVPFDAPFAATKWSFRRTRSEPQR